jgi:hypothetical protein
MGLFIMKIMEEAPKKMVRNIAIASVGVPAIKEIVHPTDADFVRSPMREKKLTSSELFELTTGPIGHCNNIEQLEFIIRFSEKRIEHLRRRQEKLEKHNKDMQTLKDSIEAYRCTSRAPTKK